MHSRTTAALFALAAAPAWAGFSYPQAQTFVRRYCAGCHQGPRAAGGMDLARAAAASDWQAHSAAWTRVLTRVREGQMPPSAAPSPPADERERLVGWLDESLRTAACADGVSPGRAPLRRLTRSEYAATLRDLLDVHAGAAHSLPADGAGGEGFDNAAETLTLSPLHAERYLEAAREALGHAAREPRFRKRFLSPPTPEETADAASRARLEAFLRLAFRRPLAPGEGAPYCALAASARARGESFDDALLFAFRAALVSPHFLFRIPEPNPGAAPRLAGHYEMASRLSYFLWGSLPDAPLFELAAQGRLHDPAALAAQAARMLKDNRARDFAASFVEQWLGTRELGREIKPDPQLFPFFYDSELESAIRYEPILFFQELLASDRPLTDLIDSDWAIVTNKLLRHYALPAPQIVKVGQQPVRIVLPEGSGRGGLLGMAAVLAVSSYPRRTSPVLRGKWVLDTLLGTPPPPPPPDVPQLPESAAARPASVRERLEQHRRNPVCAGCHDRIDPIGFALETYDPVGRRRADDAGRPIDTHGELPGGERIDGPDGLKRALAARRGLLVRNLAARMLGYALGRGLTLEDRCEVERIAGVLEREGFRAQSLVREIVLSIPFRWQEGADPGRPVPQEKQP